MLQIVRIAQVTPRNGGKAGLRLARKGTILPAMRRLVSGPVFAVVLTCLVSAGHGANDATPSPAPTLAATPSPTPTPPTGAHAATEPVKKELTAVIDGQLAAFRANDYPKAFSYASAGIQSMFAPEDFEKMVKTAYPVIAHSVSSEYGVMFDTGEEAVVNVRMEDADKKSVEYQYLLKKESGTWKINGVSEVKAEGLSV